MFQVQRKQKYMHHRARERQEEKRTPRPHNIPFITRHMDDPARLNAFRTVFWTVLWSWTWSVLGTGGILGTPVWECSDDGVKSAPFIFTTSIFVLR